MRVRDEVGA